MAALSEQPHRSLRLSTLAVLADGYLSRLSQVVTRLERRGFDERSPDPEDGRYTVGHLTDAGGDKVVATAPGHVEEVRQLRAIGDRVNRVIEGGDPAASYRRCRPPSC